MKHALQRGAPSDSVRFQDVTNPIIVAKQAVVLINILQTHKQTQVR